MTLFRQLFFGASLLFLLVLAGVEAIYLSNARLYLQQQLESHSQDSATSLSLWLATVKPFEDRALIETVVNTAFERGYYQSIRVVSTSGETLAEKELPPAQGEVPVWFTRLFPLHPPSAEALISAGWRQLGRVLVTSHPNFAYLQLWHTGVQTLALLLLVYALTLIALRVFLATLLRPLSAIERAATAIGERDFSAITLKPKARELARVVAAMNSLSAKIRFVIESESARAQTLQREAYRDPVTGLLNRRGLEHDLAGLLHAERDVFSGVFVLLELERFKEYNLHRGYQRADELLALVAQAITGASPRPDRGRFTNRRGELRPVRNQYRRGCCRNPDCPDHLTRRGGHRRAGSDRGDRISLRRGAFRRRRAVAARVAGRGGSGPYTRAAEGIEYF